MTCPSCSVTPSTVAQGPWMSLLWSTVQALCPLTNIEAGRAEMGGTFWPLLGPLITQTTLSCKFLEPQVLGWEFLLYDLGDSGTAPSKSLVCRVHATSLTHPPFCSPWKSTAQESQECLGNCCPPAVSWLKATFLFPANDHSEDPSSLLVSLQKFLGR